MPLTGSFTALLLVSLLAGLGNGLGSGINMTLGSDLAPPGGADAFLGTWWMVSDVGRSSGPMLIGAIAEALALGVAPLVTSVFGIAGMVILVLFGSETRPAHSRAQDGREERERARPLGGG
jgi:MFS family permease